MQIDIVAVSDVIASSCASEIPCCFVLVASCPRPRLVCTRQGVSRQQCTIALFRMRVTTYMEAKKFLCAVI